MSQSVNNRFKLRPISAALLAALAAPVAMPGFAEDAPPETPPAAGQSSTGESVLPEVKVRAQGEGPDYNAGVTSTGGKMATPIRDVPQSVTVINRGVMNAQGVTSLKDALRNVPGITLSSGEGGNIGDNVNIRGYNARTDMFVDGFRDRGQYARETFFLESVDVLKGPSSMLFGRGSTGGVINQVSKQADLNTRREVSTGIGTDNYHRTTVDVNQKASDTSAFRVSALAHSDESTRDVVESERYGIAPTVRFGIGTPTEIVVSALHQRSNEIPDYGLPFTPGGTTESPATPVETDINHFFGFTDDFFDQKTDALGLNITHKFSPALSLRNQIRFNNTDTHAAPTVFPSGAPAGETRRNRRERKQEDESLYNQTDLIAKFGVGTTKHTVVSGVEVGRDKFFQQQYTWTAPDADHLNQDIDDPVYGPMPGDVVRTRNATRAENEAETLAVYVNDTIEIGQHWKLIGGLRWDRFTAEANSINNMTEVKTTTARTDRMLSTRAGVIYQPDDRQSYYVSYGTSFNPSAETLTLSATNEALEPEENRSYELGAKWDLFAGKLAFSAALFRVEKTNARALNDDLQTDLVGHTRVDGFEIGASGQLAPNWQIFASYTNLDGEIVDLVESGGDRSGNALPNTPEQSASLWTVYGFAGSWEVGGGAVYSTERFLNTANSAYIDGYTRLDATVAYKQKDYDLRLNILNLNDEEYFEAASAARAAPGKGRTGVVTLTYKF